MYKRLFQSIIIFGAAAAAPPAHSQVAPACLARSELVEQLETRYHEAPAAIGLSGPNQLIEVWTSEETGTFTILVTRPDGISCFLATGDAWQSVIARTVMGTPS